MNQTRLGSFYEACFNIAIGLVISQIANMTVLVEYGCPLTHQTAFELSVIYTLISLVRQYIIRRWFNARLHAAAQRLAGARP